MELFKVHGVEEAKELLGQYFQDFTLAVEELPIGQALGRYLAEDVISQIDVPHFRRSTVDGYAVLAKDTVGASESMPVFLLVSEEVEMGREAKSKLTSGQAAYVPTGGMLPGGADSVVMVEYTEKLDATGIAVHYTTAPKENVVEIGDDIRKGSHVLQKGLKIRPQDIGVLASIGLSTVKVFQKPKFAVISTGDEIVSPDEEAKPGQIKDINTFTLAAMVEAAGGVVVAKDVVKDNFTLLKQTIESVMTDSDIIILSGGSSVGTKDIVPKVINAVGEPGVFVHGISIKPGKPTIMAKAGGKPIFGLPGHPTSAMIVFKVFVEYFIKTLMQNDELDKFIMGELAVNVHSAQGRETYQMVTLEKSGDKYIVKPVYGKSGFITLMSKAIGYIKIPINQEGLTKGEKVKVYLF